MSFIVSGGWLINELDEPVKIDELGTKIFILGVCSLQSLVKENYNCLNLNK
ncbi:hypothetical protein RchiOBHm_Chr1g0366011 [Rosa chinensis]|nr:hypothetical protein RchiOBHm_Chr1g0366011 [Rosa chinensis]